MSSLNSKQSWIMVHYVGETTGFRFSEVIKASLIFCFLCVKKTASLWKLDFAYFKTRLTTIRVLTYLMVRGGKIRNNSIDKQVKKIIIISYNSL